MLFLQYARNHSLVLVPTNALFKNVISRRYWPPSHLKKKKLMSKWEFLFSTITFICAAVKERLYPYYLCCAAVIKFVDQRFISIILDHIWPPIYMRFVHLRSHTKCWRPSSSPDHQHCYNGIQDLSHEKEIKYFCNFNAPNRLYPAGWYCFCFQL
jgi:hypothetical protein